MTRGKKEPPAVTIAGVALWMKTSTGYTYTEAVGHADTGSELESLDCECGKSSDVSDWPASDLFEKPDVACVCPHCGAEYVLTVPHGEEVIGADGESNTVPELPEPKPVEALATVERLPEHEPPQKPADGEQLEKALGIQTLAEEWMDLEYRLEQLDDEKRSFMAGWKKDTVRVTKRISELKNEIQAIKAGDFAPKAEPSPTPERQVPLFDDV